MKKNFRFAENFKKNKFEINENILNDKPNIKVCIILPTYQRSDSCINVINNILQQNHSCWKLIVIDDGSDEEHLNKKTKYIENLNDVRIKYIKNIVNKKIPATLNVGLKIFLESDCEYVTWVSDDNIYYKNYLDNLLLESDFSYSAFLLKTNEMTIMVNKQYVKIQELLDDFHGLASFMWSKNAILKIGFYNEDLFLCEDYDYLLRTFKIIRDIKYSSDIGMTYILSDDSLTTKKHEESLSVSNKIKNIYRHAY